MIFSNPGALWLLLLAVPLVVLHLWRERPRRVIVPSIAVWVENLEHASRRSWLRHLHDLPLLLLQLAALSLLSIAAAGPRDAAEGPLVVVLDNSPGMLARHGNRSASRFEGALALAQRELGAASPSRPVAVVTTSPHARIAAGFQPGDAELNTHVADRSGSTAEAVHLAQSLLAIQGEGEILILTDRIPAIESEQATVRTKTIAFGGEQENAGFVAAGMRRPSGSGNFPMLFFSLGNFTGQDRRFWVEVNRQGGPVAEIPLDVAAGETGNSTTMLPLSPDQMAGAEITLRLQDWSDQLQQDNQIRVPTHARAPGRLLLVSDGSPFVELLLRSLPEWELEILAPEQWEPRWSAAFDVTLVDRVLPPAFSPELMEGKAWMFVGTGPWGVDGTQEIPIVTSRRAGHPVVRAPGLESIRVLQACRLALPPGAPGAETTDWLLLGPDGPLLIAGEQEDTKWLAWAFSPENSDLPLRLAFPILFHDALRWLAETGDAPARWNVRARQDVDLRQRSSEAGADAGLAAAMSWLWQLAAALAACALAVEWWLWRRHASGAS